MSRLRSTGLELDERIRLPVPLEQAGCVLQLSTKKEADVHMSLEDVDIAERHIVYTRDRTPIVDQLSHVVTAVPELRKPLSRNP